MTDDSVIEEAAKAIAAFTDPSAWTAFRGEAEAAFAVFEKAHASTDDEREALARLVQAAKDMRSWFTEKADNVLGRIKTDTHEDVMLYHDAVSILVTARQIIGLLADSETPGPQGEPSDVQVEPYPQWKVKPGEAVVVDEPKKWADMTDLEKYEFIREVGSGTEIAIANAWDDYVKGCAKDVGLDFNEVSTLIDDQVTGMWTRPREESAE